MKLPFCPESAVSEILGALLLIAVISLAVSIVAVTLLSSVDTTQTPALSILISNSSQNITISHGGGDPLPAGSYRIFVNDVNRTASFTPAANSTQFKAGTTLTYKGSSIPRTAMVIYIGPDGSEAVLVQKSFS
ncbi:MAG: type IV pilin N-terminal domain-containing protein [Methanolinea sp.]